MNSASPLTAARAAGISGSIRSACLSWALLLPWVCGTIIGLTNAVVGFWFIIAALLILPFGIANIFVTIRRLHDMGYSGYWYFALLAAGMFASALDKVVPVASLIVTVIVYVCLSQKSQPGLNKYDVTE